MEIISHPSPNHGARRGGLRPELIVLHYTAMQDAGAALERLCAPEHEVSAHYLIAADGRVFALVDEARRAWHAGAGSWRGRDDVNSRSIGIELDNPGDRPFGEAQMAALEALLGEVMARWGIGPEGVIGHSDMAPLRKADPGRLFDWPRLVRAGLAVAPEPEEGAGDPLPCDEGAFLRDAACFGYPEGDGAQAVLEALRQRFRPAASGPLSAADMALVRALAARFPVDRGPSSA